jgi:amidase
MKGDYGLGGNRMSVNIEQWIIEADIGMMQAALAAGTITSLELVRTYIERIKRHDQVLRSVLELNPDAEAIAQALDEERRTAGARGALHGIPLLLKDNIDTADRMQTSAGSLALADSYAAADSFVAARLRAAGAVLLGKTNMTEWANFMSGTMWAGYSSRGGQTLNPYGPGELFIGGSSSGSASAVAANLAAAAIGTETSGSIISPACYNGLVGLKPTVGLVSRSGIIPITWTQDTAGPMTRTVTDAAILLSALAGADERDPATAAVAAFAVADYTTFLDAACLAGTRIGVPRHYCQRLDAARLAILDAAIGALRAAGAEVIDPVEFPCEQAQWVGKLMRYEFKKGINDYLAKVDEALPVHSLDELIAYNESHAAQALKYGQGTLIWANETSGTLTEPEYWHSLHTDKALAREQGIDWTLQRYNLDALLCLGDEGGDEPAAIAGYPVITVPGGWADTSMADPEGYPTSGPQGITFVGTAYSEGKLLGIAYAYEQATRHRKPPTLFL